MIDSARQESASGLVDKIVGADDFLSAMFAED